MEKRVILAFVLSIAVVWGFQALYRPTPPPAPEQSAAAMTETPAVVPPTPPPTSVPQGAESSPPTAIAASAAEDSFIETELYTAAFSNNGGVLKSFKLKEYSDAEGRPIELIDPSSGAALGWPLSFSTGDAALDEVLAKSNFVVRREGNTINFEFADNGVHATKTVEFSPDHYELRLRTAVTRNGSSVPHKVVWRGRFGDQSIPPDPALTQGIVGSDGSFERIPVGDLEAPAERTTSIAGVEDRYFLAAFVLDQPAGVQASARQFPDSAGAPISTLEIAVPSSNELRAYVGPKAENWLARTDPRLPAVVDYGFFEVITRPLLFALLWIHSYVGNFGWAIIFLTILINFILFPLRLKQQTSMQKMQKLQPQMRTLQDRYKKLKANDPRRAEVQMEMMNLYKQNGVNPMGGCLPLLLQMPLLFAFWNMLSVSIELRQAPFILWIHDLSQHDPYYIIPILMAASMLVSTKMMPTTMDPAQARMMMIMPIVLSVMFLWLQAGVTLHYLTSNVVGIGQQWFIMKYWSADKGETPHQRKPKKASAE